MSERESEAGRERERETEREPVRSKDLFPKPLHEDS